MVVESTVTAVISPLDAKGAVRKQLAPYLIELGLVVVSWNELHDELGQLFSIVRGGPSLGCALEIWHSEKSDWNQRKLIRSELPPHYPTFRVQNRKARNGFVELAKKYDGFWTERTVWRSNATTRFILP
jgi:hypothetical protein